MLDYFSHIQFARPFLFWLALGLPLLWLRFREQSFFVLLLRSIVLLLLIATLAEPQTVSPKPREQSTERIFAFDVSRSIPSSMRQWMRRMGETFALSAADRFFVFAGETKHADSQEALSAGGAIAGVRPERTSLENLFSNLLALPPAPRSVYLFTDGWETEGNIEKLLPAIAAANLKIFPIVRAQPFPVANVAVSKVVAPTHGDSGQSVNLKIVLENQNDRDAEGTLTVTRNGEPFKTEAVQLKPGSQIFTYEATLPEAALTSYAATFKARRPESDNYAPDNEAVAWVTVHTKAKVLVVNGATANGRYLEQILKRQGFEVNVRNAENPPLPNGYGVVVFNNVEREKLSAGYLRSIQRFVDGGGAFLMLGADASFSPNSYKNTPIEEVLPVVPKEPKREEKNRAIVLVIDKSGSMREENKMLYAQEAAKAVARQLKDNDLLAVVGFDISPFVVVPMESVGRLRGSVDGLISRLRPGGQTYFYPALLEAKRQLERANAPRKHVILISDGETRGTQGELVDLINVMKNEMKITVSTVAVGIDADVRVMKRISQYGGGLFHHTLDPSTLPQIVLQQLKDDTKDDQPADKEFVPVQERGTQVLAGFSVRSYPPLRGYMDTELKRGAHLDIAIPRDDRKAPLLASWQYGRGKAIAMTTDMEGRWSRAWIQWPELQRFWDKVFGWLRPNEEAIPEHEARVTASEHEPVLDLFVYDEASGDSRFRFVVTGKGINREGVLKKLAPGHFMSTLPLTTPGDYRIQITEERKTRQIAYPAIGYTLLHGFDSELPRPNVNTAILLKLAQSTGGEINPTMISPTPPAPAWNYTPVRQPFILIAVFLFMLEIALRKLVFGEPD